MTTLIDTSALIYIVDHQSPFHEWATATFNALIAEGPVIVSDIVYAEFSAGMPTKNEVDEVVTLFGLERMGMTDDALYAAGIMFRKYKQDNDGPKLNVLPDFLIAAQAIDIGAPLFTGNTKDFRKLYSDIELICP